MEILKSLGDCVLAIGESDEYSFVFKRQAKLFNRRREKILTTIVSQFSAMYVFYWPQFISTLEHSRLHFVETSRYTHQQSL